MDQLEVLGSSSEVSPAPRIVDLTLSDHDIACASHILSRKSTSLPTSFAITLIYDFEPVK